MALGCSIDDLAFSAGGTAILEGVDLEVPAGALVTVLGPSGCGKTTLLRILAGLEEPDRGTIRLGGVVWNDPVIRVPCEKRGVGMVFQDPSLWPHMTALQHLEFVLKPHVRAKRECTLEARRLLAVWRVEPVADRRPPTLSGGERQRLALARSIASRPRIWLLDEPLSNLDRNLVDELREEIRRHQREWELTTLYVTHNQEEALSLSDRIAVMKKGRMVQEGRPEEIYRAPRDLFVATFVGRGSVLSGRMTSRSRLETKLGSHATQRADGLSAGAPAAAFVRPEDIRILPAATAPIRGRVADARYEGSRRLLTVVAGGIELLVESRPEPSISPGDEVGLEIREPVLCFPETPPDA